MDNWESLRSECLACKRCGLWETRKHVVFGVGPQDAEVLFIGEGPGEQEDLKGEPFVGRGGKLLDDMLELIDLDRTKIYIANMVKCRPPKNRDPLETEQYRLLRVAQPPDRAAGPEAHRLPGQDIRHEIHKA